MSQNILISNWGISSELICNEAEKRWYWVNITSKEKNLFSVSHNSKEIYFKSVDCWLNTSFWLKSANDKEITYLIGSIHDIKVPKSIYLDLWETLDFKTLSSQLQTPVISKPIDGAHGDWVFLNICNESDLSSWIEYSFWQGASRIVIQEQIPWDDHRIIVCGDRVVAATKRVPPSIVWDGVNTIIELIHKENKNPDRLWEDHVNKMSPIKIDTELENCLQAQGYNKKDVLKSWKQIFVRKNANLSSGGSAIDVTDILHDDVKQQSIEIASRLWLGFCGVDVFSTDISQSLEATWWAIIEVNATPGIRMHHFPSQWQSRDVAWAILDRVFSM